MKIGVVGSGSMGTALGKALAAKGHSVFFGSRTPRSVAGFQTGTYEEAVRHGEIIILTTTWECTLNTVKGLKINDKIIIDCTNPETHDGRGLAVGHTTSGSEEIAKICSGARIVKAFCHVYAEMLTVPAFGTEKASVFYCGDDSDAKAVILKFIAEMGFDPVDAGPLKSARYIEPLAMLMVQLVREMKMGPDRIAMKLLKR